MMRRIEVSLLLGFVCPPILQPVLSFLVHPPYLWSTSSRAPRPQQQKQRQPFHDTNAAQSLVGARASTTIAARGYPAFLSDKTVSCHRNLDTESTVYLVGVVHNARQSCKLVERVIRRVQPQVVMVEVDAHRLRLLPPGEAMKGEDGLCWWTPLPEPDERTSASEELRDGGEGEMTSVVEGQGHTCTPPDGLESVLKKSRRRRRQSGKEPIAGDEVDMYEDVCEFYTAAVEAVACGARVLLGDREFKETQRRLLEAEREDQEDRTRPRNEKSGEGRVVEARVKRRGLESTPPAVWRKMRDLEKAWGPRKFAVLMTERDQVMSSCLMRLEGNQDIVAVVGAHHMVGIGSIFEANGWKTRR